MDFEDFPEIERGNEEKLRDYWKYLETYRAKMDNSLFSANEIAAVFIAPIGREL